LVSHRNGRALFEGVRKQGAENIWTKKMRKSNINTKLKASLSALFTKYYCCDQIKENSMGRTCSTHEGGDTFIEKLSENVKGVKSEASMGG
jgi:hypothetical protein